MKKLLFTSPGDQLRRDLENRDEQIRVLHKGCVDGWSLLRQFVLAWKSGEPANVGELDVVIESADRMLKNLEA